MSPEFSFPTVTYGISNLLFNSTNTDLSGRYCGIAYWPTLLTICRNAYLHPREAPHAFVRLLCKSAVRSGSHLYLRLSQTLRAKTIRRRYRSMFPLMGGINRQQPKAGA